LKICDDNVNDILWFMFFSKKNFVFGGINLWRGTEMTMVEIKVFEF